MKMKTKLNLRQAALVALCAFALSPAALLAGNTPKTAEESGTIKSVDSHKHQIVVANHKTKTEGTFQWNDQTRFTAHDRTVNAGALKEGLPVQLSYVKDSGTAQLLSVKLMPQKALSHPSAAPSSQPKP
jgi:hypothetical protein